MNKASEVVVRVLLTTLLALLSWNGLQVCTRLSACEADITALKISSKESAVRIEQMFDLLSEIRQDVKALMQRR